jgi:hypothetical protein
MLTHRYPLLGSLLAVWCSGMSGVMFHVAQLALLIMHFISGIFGIASSTFISELYRRNLQAKMRIFALQNGV